MKDLVDLFNEAVFPEEIDLDISKEICYSKRTPRLREGFVCPECGRNVLEYEQPFFCKNHE
jgi:hypothetical protein